MKTKRAAVLVLLSTLLLGTTPVIGVEQTGAPAAPPDGGGGMGGADTMTYDYSGDLTGSLVADNQEITSTSEAQRSDGSDKNTALVKNGGTLTLEKSTLEKTGASANDDNSNFYGLNSILLAVNQDSFAYLSNSQLTASDQGRAKRCSTTLTVALQGIIQCDSSLLQPVIKIKITNRITGLHTIDNR